MATKINIADVQGLIALAILNNKPALISVLNSSGYAVPSNISDSQLFDVVGKIGDDESMSKMQRILAQVPWDTTKLTQQEARNLAIKFTNANPNAKFSDWLSQLGQGIGDFLSGTSVVNQNPNITTQNSEPAISPVWIVITAIIGIIGIIFVNNRQVKGATTISWVIGLVVLAVTAFGIFAKKVTITAQGGGGSQNVHNGALGWIKGILNGLHLSVTG